MLMQLWIPEFELDKINSGSWYHCLPIRIYHWKWEGDCASVVCEVVCCMEVRPALQRAEMRMVRWMCGVKLQDRVPSKRLRDRLWLDDIIMVLQQNRLRWYGHVLRKEDNNYVKKCLEYEVEGARPRCRLKKTWRDCRKRLSGTQTEQGGCHGS